MGKIKTLKDIEEENLNRWKDKAKREVKSQIILDELKKRKMIKRKDAKIVQEKINKLGKEILEEARGSA